ncbi:MAG: hypothetical protein F6K10_13440 [Moorea sp. SIO2B7]|nr:hypothetical protein [Moorena sp. SIO2B7]
MDTDVRLAGQIDGWPNKNKMAALLRAAGLEVTVGTYSISINDCEHFVLQEYGGDLGDPCFDADAESLDVMLYDARRVSAALAAANIRHRFELYSDDNELVGYLHHQWAQLPGIDGAPYESTSAFCPHCDDLRTEKEFEYLCVVPELGNIVRYHCKICSQTFTQLPPSFVPKPDG